MKGFFALLALTVAVMGASANAQPQSDNPGAASQSTAQNPESQDKNLLLALSRMAGMRVCDRMRNRFRTLTAGGRDNEPASSGTLWIEDCVANTDGTRLSISLGGRGWRWIYRKKSQAGATFTVAQYAAFAVDIGVEGEIDAAYDPAQQVFRFWYRPTAEPDVSFRPLGDVEVDSEGLWSSVVGSAAGLFSQSPSARAREQLQSRGRESFKERFSQGFSASLDFCTGEMEMGFGLSAGKEEEGSQQSNTGSTNQEVGQKDQGTPAYMHPGGLIMDGPYDVDPSQFAVTIESDSPLEAALICEDEATRVARAFLDNQELPEVKALKGTRASGSTDLDLQRAYVNCPVVVAFRAIPGAPEQAFGFEYNIASAPMMEPAQTCENRAQAGVNQ